MDVSEHYVLLRAAPTTAGSVQLRSRATDVVVEHGPARVALDPEGLPHLLVPVAPGAHVSRDAGSKGVVLASRTLVLGGDDVLFADLACLDSRLTLVFEHLVEDALQRLRSSSEPVERLLAVVLGEWRQLLQVATSERLDRETAMGLAAELEVLALLASASPSMALDAWRGPAQEPHDFLHLGRALEVKATAAVDPNFIRISNLDQLDATLVQRLHLVVLHFREESDGASLDDRIRKLFALGVDRQSLIMKASQYGYVFESGMQTSRFTTRGFKIWLVSEEFPGLTRRRLPTTASRGVSRVSYQLDLDVAGDPLAINGDARTQITKWML